MHILYIMLYQLSNSNNGEDNKGPNVGFIQSA